MGELRQFEQPPDYGDGDDGGEYQFVDRVCENCSENDYALWFCGDVGTLVCKCCGKPQEDVVAMEVGYE